MAAEPQLTPACELAFVVAREAVPPLAVPAALQPFLGTAEPSRRALSTVQRALEADEAFRRRVAERATEEAVGRVGWLWLHRPAGWDAELAERCGHRGPGAAPASTPDVEPRWKDEAPADAAPLAPVTGPGPDPEPAAPADAPVGVLPVDPQRDTQVESAGEGSGPAGVEPGPVAEGSSDAELELGEVDPDAGVEAAPVDGPNGPDESTAAGVEGRAERDEAEEPVRGVAIEQEIHTLRAMVEQLVSGDGYEAGPAVRQLGRELAAAELARDEMQAAVVAMAEERDEAVARASSLSDDLARMRTDLDEVTAQRARLQAELERVLSQHVEVARAHDAMVGELSEQLRRALADRDRARAEVARSDQQVERVQHVVARALTELAEEVDGVRAPLGDAADALSAVGTAVERAAEQARWIQGDLAALASGAPVVSGCPALPDLIDDAPGGPNGTGDESPPADEADLAGALAAYGVGWPGSTGGTAAGDVAAGVPDPLGDELRAAGIADPLSDELSDLSRGLSDALTRYLVDQGTERIDGDGAADRAGTAAGSAPVEADRALWSDRLQRPAAGRSPVDVPVEVRGDQLATARFLAAVPDVVLVIPGDEVAGLGWATLTVAEQRDALTSYLADLTAGSGAAADVVFDGGAGGEDTVPATEVVRVRLTAPGITVPGAVAALVDTYPTDWPVVVVTDDPALAADAARQGANVLSALGLLDLFIAR